MSERENPTEEAMFSADSNSAEMPKILTEDEKAKRILEIEQRLDGLKGPHIIGGLGAGSRAAKRVKERDSLREELEQLKGITPETAGKKE